MSYNNLNGSAGNGQTSPRYKSNTRVIVLSNWAKGGRKYIADGVQGERVKCSQKCGAGTLYSLMFWRMESGVRIHGTERCRGCSMVCRHWVQSVARKVQSSVTMHGRAWCWWVPGAASWGRLSGSCPKLDNTLTAEQCNAALRYNTVHHRQCSGEPASARGYRGRPGAVPSLTPDLEQGGHLTQRSSA